MVEETRGQEAAGAHGEEAEAMERLQEEIRNLPVAEHVVYMMHSLSSLAVGRMGLMPESSALRDLDQARLAIDAFKALVEVMERATPAREMAAHRGMLSQLQLAYVGALDAPRDAPPDAELGAEPHATSDAAPEELDGP